MSKWMNKLNAVLGVKTPRVEEGGLSGAASSVPLEAIVEASQNLHGSGTFSAAGLRALARYAQSIGNLRHSVETGSGASTLLLSHLSRQHVTFSLDSGSGSLENVRKSSLFSSKNVSIIEGPSQLTLPKYRFNEPIQFALIDGPHGYPFPDLEYFHLYPHIERGGILVLDDTHIRTIHNLMEFLRVDDMWKLEEVVEGTAFFRRTDAVTFPPTGDGWWLQNYNRVDQ